MKYLHQAAVILLFSFLGELLHAALPLQIPASIYGMVLLFAALSLKLVKPEQVSDTGHFMVNIMAVLFVCPAVGLISCIELIKEHWLAICAVLAMSFPLTFFVTGRVTQALLKRNEGKE